MSELLRHKDTQTAFPMPYFAAGTPKLRKMAMLRLLKTTNFACPMAGKQRCIYCYFVYLCTKFLLIVIFCFFAYKFTFYDP